MQLGTEAHCIRWKAVKEFAYPRPDPEIFKEGVDLVAVIYNITNFLFSNEIL